jgi:protocatechuate 3,4-dioxygenase beta subunit
MRAVAAIVLLAGFSCVCRAGPELGTVELGRIAAALESQEVSISEVLTDPKLMSLHPDARFRQLIREHARPGIVTLVSPNEPGRRLSVTGVISDPDGRPIPGAIIYVFHTDSSGFYTEKRAMDESNARLFAYLQTGAAGEYEFRSIRPGGYPTPVTVDGEPFEIPQHVHFVVTAPGYREGRFQMYFSDDPRLRTEQSKQAAKRAGHPMIVPTETEGGGQHCVFHMTLERE